MRNRLVILGALAVPLLMAQGLPYQGPPAGYSVDNPLPALALGASYSIPIAFYAVNR